MSTTNFNYQVALKEGLKNLQQGRLRQAEQSFRYLVDKFPGAEGGYRGLAKVYFEQEDRSASLRVLRDGAAALTKSGERSAAIGLLREAVTLDPKDLGTHRRLAAALALAGDAEAAVQEYARFIRDLRESGEASRAQNEAAYALGQLKDVPGLAELDEIANGRPARSYETSAAPRAREAATAQSPAHQEPSPEKSRVELTPAQPREATPTKAEVADPWSMPRPERATESFAATTPPGPAIDDSGADPWAAPPPVVPTPPQFEQPIQAEAVANDPWKGSAAPAHANAPEQEASGDGPAAAAKVVPLPADERPGDGESLADADPAAVEAAAARYLATRDPRAAALALEAARRYIKDGQTDAASDLLLQLIAAGVADHDAQRLLVDVARTLGKREVAKTKCQLLVQALLLDGRNDLAAEVEALAQAE